MESNLTVISPKPLRYTTILIFIVRQKGGGLGSLSRLCPLNLIGTRLASDPLQESLFESGERQTFLNNKHDSIQKDLCSAPATSSDPTRCFGE